MTSMTPARVTFVGMMVPGPVIAAASAAGVVSAWTLGIRMFVAGVVRASTLGPCMLVAGVVSVSTLRACRLARGMMALVPEHVLVDFETVTGELCAPYPVALVYQKTRAGQHAHLAG